MFSLRQLEYLVAVVEEGSFTRAAVALHVTQPALSHQVRTMEREVGAVLFERSARAVALTPAGRAMLPHARATLAQARRARSAALKAAGAIEGELRVAAVYSVSLGILPAALRVWSVRHPGVDVHLFEHRHADELQAAMEAGQADLAVGPPPRSWPGTVRVLGTEDFVLVCAADHRLALAGTTEVDLAELRDERWVHFAPGNGLGAILDGACLAAGFEPRTAIRTEQTASAPALAAAGLGLALVPADIVPAAFDGHLVTPRPGVDRTLVAYTRAVADPLATAFTDVLAASTVRSLAREGGRSAGVPPRRCP